MPVHILSMVLRISLCKDETVLASCTKYNATPTYTYLNLVLLIVHSCKISEQKMDNLPYSHGPRLCYEKLHLHSSKSIARMISEQHRPPRSCNYNN